MHKLDNADMTVWFQKATCGIHTIALWSESQDDVELFISLHVLVAELDAALLVTKLL